MVTALTKRVRALIYSLRFGTDLASAVLAARGLWNFRELRDSLTHGRGSTVVFLVKDHVIFQVFEYVKRHV